MNRLLLRYFREHPRLLYAAITGLSIIAVLLTLIPTEYLASSTVLSYDKVGHLFLFGSWTFLIGLHRLIHAPLKTDLWKVFLLGILFGAMIEVLQYLLPVNRNADIWDFGFDTFGALAAVLLLKIWFSPSAVPQK